MQDDIPTQVAEECARQGLPATLEDPEAVRKIAALIVAAERRRG